MNHLPELAARRAANDSIVIVINGKPVALSDNEAHLLRAQLTFALGAQVHELAQAA